MIDGFVIKPPDYAARVNGVVSLMGNDDVAASARLASLIDDVRALPGAVPGPS